MAHFAEIDKDSVVKRVVVVDNSIITDSSGNENELLGIHFLKSICGENTEWVQTSYNNTIRGVFAGEGMFYDKKLNIFIRKDEGNIVTIESPNPNL